MNCWHFFITAITCCTVQAQQSIQPETIALDTLTQYAHSRNYTTLAGDFRVEVGIKHPYLETFVPTVANGTTIMLIPGGTLYTLNSENEGQETARWLQQKGFLVYLYRYALKTSNGGNYSVDALRSFILPSDYEKVVRDDVYRKAVADGFLALNNVWEDVTKRGLNTRKIAIMGFSLGASMAFDICTAVSEGSPGYLISINGFVAGAATDHPSVPPPAFIACNKATPLREPYQSAKMYQDYYGKSTDAELHIYSTNGSAALNENLWQPDFEKWLSSQLAVK